MFARISRLRLSQLGRRFVLAEILGERVSLRGPRLRWPPKPAMSKAEVGPETTTPPKGG